MKTTISIGISVLLLAALLGLGLPGFPTNGKTTKESFETRGGKRTYYLFVPKDLPQSSKIPLLMTFHGSNRNGYSLVEKWQDLAGKDGFIIAGPDSRDSKAWNVPADGPDMLYELAELLKSKYPIDPRRVYLFGHSAGAVFALNVGLLESEYFAAVAVHAGAFRDESEYAVVNFAERKIPLAIFVGVSDQFFPLGVVRATRDALVKVGFPVELTEIPHHDHWYYNMAPRINRSAWDFLKTKQLDSDPHYETRSFQ